MLSAIIEWEAWNNYLLPYIFPDSQRITIDLLTTDYSTENLSRIIDSYDYLSLQINLSLISNLPFIKCLDKLPSHYRCRIINYYVRNITKLNMHAHLTRIGLRSTKAEREGNTNAELFVKTNLNYGGEKEKKIKKLYIDRTNIFTYLDPLISNEMSSREYFLTRRRCIPELLWSEPSLIIEDFIQNRDNSFHRVYFGGSRVVLIEAYSESLIKKVDGDSRNINYVFDVRESCREYKDELSEDLIKSIISFIYNTRIDFGSIDILHNDNQEYFIVDINQTPFAGSQSPEEELCIYLREGLLNCIKSPFKRNKPIILTDACL